MQPCLTAWLLLDLPLTTANKRLLSVRGLGLGFCHVHTSTKQSLGSEKCLGTKGFTEMGLCNKEAW